MIKMFGKSRYTPPGNLFAHSVKIKIESLERMLQYLTESGLDNKSRLEKLYEKYPVTEDNCDEFRDFLIDEFWMVTQAESFAKLLAIVGLYMLVEEETKTIMKWVLSEEEIYNCYKWEYLKKIVRNFGFELKNLAMFKTVDELHHLNNDIKHNGKVSKALAEYPGWTTNTKIRGDAIDFDKFKNAIPKYIEDLSDKVNDELVKSPGSKRQCGP
jgi:hypothetical protein